MGSVILVGMKVLFCIPRYVCTHRGASEGVVRCTYQRRSKNLLKVQPHGIGAEGRVVLHMPCSSTQKKLATLGSVSIVKISVSFSMWNL